jgi:hypothetical protein
MTSLATKLAAVLLLKRGEITISDIEALPLVDDERQALLIADELAEMFKACCQQRRSRAVGAESSYDEVITLTATCPAHSRSTRKSKR